MIAVCGLRGLAGPPGTGPRGWAVDPFFWLPTVPLGVVHSWLRYRSGSVWPCALAHGMANCGLQTLAIYALFRPGTPFLGLPAECWGCCRCGRSPSRWWRPAA